jgi:hypothetical protein
LVSERLYRCFPESRFYQIERLLVHRLMVPHHVLRDSLYLDI